MFFFEIFNFSGEILFFGEKCEKFEKSRKIRKKIKKFKKLAKNFEKSKKIQKTFFVKFENLNSSVHSWDPTEYVCQVL